MKYLINFYFNSGNLANFFVFDDEKKFLSLARSLKKNLSDNEFQCVEFGIFIDGHSYYLCPYSIDSSLKKIKSILNEVIK